ncbi:MAG: DUF3095 family protein [Leptospiraceae bacterium]|nr:DUF3095 family protein [Leptospiraceae bacterium]
MSIDFYKNLKPISQFKNIENETTYSKVPEDWWIVITDIVNSTKAIENGRYKDVNISGAISITAIVNEKLYEQVPIIFGGDGITLVCPKEFLKQIQDVLFGTKLFVKESYGLELRIGSMPIKELYEADEEILLGKFSSSHPFEQAIFLGDGIEYAEKKIKSPNSPYILKDDYVAEKEPDYSGFSCPFVDVKSSKGPVFALIIKKFRANSYDKILNELMDIIGENESYPLDWRNLEFGKTKEQLSHWINIASKESSFKNKLLSFFLPLISRFASLFMNFWRRKAERSFPKFTDHKKFDGSIKMVVSCDTSRANKLKNWLEENEKQGNFYYGLHEAESSVITCIHNGANNKAESHLLDAANGGYTLAAKSLKEKLNLNIANIKR